MDTSLKDEMVETLSPMLFARKQLPVDTGNTLPFDFQFPGLHIDWASFGCQTHDGFVDMVECGPHKNKSQSHQVLF